MEDIVYNTIKDLQEGKFDKTHKDMFNPEITGHGVTVWTLLETLDNSISLEELAATAMILCGQGRITAVDPDSQGLVSFRAI